MTTPNSDKVDSYFSTDITHAHQKFEAAAKAIGVTVSRHHNPHKGPDGEDLYTSVCRIGPQTAKTVLVLLSGTHGTEGFVGSGLQVGCLNNLQQTLPIAPDTAIVMIHLINPYGTAWGRYVNEDNADLLKNFNYADNLPSTNPGFIELDDALDIKSLGAPDGWAKMLARRAALADKYDDAAAMKIFKSGQAVRPDSIVYIGQKPSWSKITLEQILTKELQGATKALYIDLHSGMGDFGDAYVIPEGSKPSHERVAKWMNGNVHDTDLNWSIESYCFIKKCAPGIDTTVAIIEGGTEVWDEEMRYINLMEMYYHLFGDRDSEAAKIVKTRFRRFYYPNTYEWRQKFWANGQKALGQFVHGLNEWSQVA
jgi:hypothetical protein